MGLGVRPFRGKPGFGRYIALMLCVALFVCVFPYPGPGVLKRTYLAASSRAPIAIVGSSTLVTVSKCDQDRRNVIDLLTDMTGHQVLDLSVGGQTLSESINLANFAGAYSPAKDIIVTLPHPYIDDWTTPPFHKLLFYKMLMPQFRVFDAANLDVFLEGFTGQETRVGQSFQFEGRAYPDYRVLAAETFQFEKDHETCPETITHDWNFTRAYYWWTQIAKQDNPSLPPLLADLAEQLKRHGRRLHVVVLPTNLELLRQFDASWPEIVQAMQKKLVADLNSRSIKVLDLSSGFGEDEFTTAWCACVHLNEKGRMHLSREMAADITADRTASR